MKVTGEALLAGISLLITGAASGLGKSLTSQLTNLGADLILCDKELRKLETLRDDLKISGDQLDPLLIPIDFEGASTEDYSTLSETIKINRKSLNGMIFCAADLGCLSPIEHYEPFIWAKVFQTNLHSVFFLLKFCMPLLDQTKPGNLIFTFAEEGRKPKANWGAYAVSKGALYSLMQLAKEELKSLDNIKVNGVIPAAMNTQLRRQAFPAEEHSSLKNPDDNVWPYIYLLANNEQIIDGDVLNMTEAPIKKKN